MIEPIKKVIIKVNDSRIIFSKSRDEVVRLLLSDATKEDNGEKNRVLETNEMALEYIN